MYDKSFSVTNAFPFSSRIASYMFCPAGFPASVICPIRGNRSFSSDTSGRRMPDKSTHSMSVLRDDVCIDDAAQAYDFHRHTGGDVHLENHIS